MNYVDDCNAFFDQPSITDCTDLFHELARLLMHESVLVLQTNTAETIKIFVILIQNIEVIRS